MAEGTNLWFKVLVIGLTLAAIGVFTLPRLIAPSPISRPSSSASTADPSLPAAQETPSPTAKLTPTSPPKLTPTSPPKLTPPPKATTLVSVSSSPSPGGNPLRPIILIRTSRCPWENGFVERDELKYFNVTNYEYTTGKVVATDPLFLKLATSRIPVVLILSATIEPCDVAKGMLSILAPIMTIMMSDEFGHSKCIHEALGQSGFPGLRQYSAIKYKYPVYENLNQQLLGTRSGMMDNITDAQFKNLTKATDRRLAWVFVGQSKTDRQEMVNKLKPFGPNEVHWNSKTPPQMAELMMEATFAPNGRGWVSLECFRLFEASRLGSIPVVVGPTTEIEVSFSYHVGYLGKLPPWIYASTWADALLKMQELYANKPMLLAKQRAVLEFWDLIVAAPRQLIDKEYEAFNYASRMKALKERIKGTNIQISIPDENN